MSNFKGDYLRVLTPLTTNGSNIRHNADGQVMYKESHLPITAQKQLEKKNKKRPVHLRHKIELVSAGFSTQNIEALQSKRIEELEKQLAAMKATEKPVKNKPEPVDPGVATGLDDDPAFEPTKKGKK